MLITHLPFDVMMPQALYLDGQIYHAKLVDTGGRSKPRFLVSLIPALGSRAKEQQELIETPWQQVLQYSLFACGGLPFMCVSTGDTIRFCRIDLQARTLIWLAPSQLEIPVYNYAYPVAPLSDTRALVIVPKSAEAFSLDVKTGQAERVANCPGGRISGTPCALSEGRVALVAGCVTYGTFSNSVFVYDSPGDRWETIDVADQKSGPEGRQDASAVCVAGKYLFVHGGMTMNDCLHDTWVLDLELRRWSPCSLGGRKPLVTRNALMFLASSREGEASAGATSGGPAANGSPTDVAGSFVPSDLGTRLGGSVAPAASAALAGSMTSELSTGSAEPAAPRAPGDGESLVLNIVGGQKSCWNVYSFSSIVGTVENAETRRGLLSYIDSVSQSEEPEGSERSGSDESDSAGSHESSSTHSTHSGLAGAGTAASGRQKSEDARHSPKGIGGGGGDEEEKERPAERSSLGPQKPSEASQSPQSSTSGNIVKKSADTTPSSFANATRSSPAKGSSRRSPPGTNWDGRISSDGWESMVSGGHNDRDRSGSQVARQPPVNSLKARVDPGDPQVELPEKSSTGSRGSQSGGASNASSGSAPHGPWDGSGNVCGENVEGGDSRTISNVPSGDFPGGSAVESPDCLHGETWERAADSLTDTHVSSHTSSRFDERMRSPTHPSASMSVNLPANPPTAPPGGLPTRSSVLSAASPPAGSQDSSGAASPFHREPVGPGSSGQQQVQRVAALLPPITTPAGASRAPAAPPQPPGPVRSRQPADEALRSRFPDQDFTVLPRDAPAPLRGNTRLTLPIQPSQRLQQQQPQQALFSAGATTDKISFELARARQSITELQKRNMMLQAELESTRRTLLEMEQQLDQERDARTKAEADLQRARSASRSLARRNVERQRHSDGAVPSLPPLHVPSVSLSAQGADPFLFSQPQASEFLGVYKQQAALLQEMLQDYLVQNRELRAQLKHYQDLEAAEGEALARQLEQEEEQYVEGGGYAGAQPAMGSAGLAGFTATAGYTGHAEYRGQAGQAGAAQALPSGIMKGFAKLDNADRPNNLGPASEDLPHPTSFAATGKRHDTTSGQARDYGETGGRSSPLARSRRASAPGGAIRRKTGAKPPAGGDGGVEGDMLF